MPQRHPILLSISVFLISYLLILVLWIQVKPYYGKILSMAGAELATGHTKSQVEYITQEKDYTNIQFTRPVMTTKGMGDIVFDIKLSVSNYTFNVPLTFALAAGLYIYFRWKPRYLLEAGIILVFVHLLYIFSFCSLELLKNLTHSQGGIVYGIRLPSKGEQFFFQFLWEFTDNMVIRFEPFLVAIYLWLRSKEFRRLLPNSE